MTYWSQHLCVRLPSFLFFLSPRSYRIQVDSRRAVSLACDVARAMIYLHSKQPPVIHRDLKPRNLLLDRAWKLKVCDFGLAACPSKFRCAGTPAYMPPELFDGMTTRIPRGI